LVNLHADEIFQLKKSLNESLARNKKLEELNEEAYTLLLLQSNEKNKTK
jgi:hypothetical protein